MRTRILASCFLTCLALAVIVGGATFAQRPEGSRLERPLQDAPFGASVDTVLRPVPELQSPSSTGVQGLLGNDPLAAADQFVAKTSKDVKDAVGVLAKEAETLRTRLQKVEAAQHRLQGVLHALEAPADEPERIMPMPMLPGPRVESN